MDPFECWKKVLESIKDDDLPEAFYSLKDLESWIEKGGFEPDGISLGIVTMMKKIVCDAAMIRGVLLTQQNELF